MNYRLPLFALGAITATGLALAGCGSDDKEPDSTVDVSLSSFKVEASTTTVKAGKIKFTAENTEAKDVHELAVLKVNGPDNFENLGEVEDIDPGKGGDVTLDLEPGEYLLACLIAPGEAGSTVDHFQQGMKLTFTVE
ncbi:MAG: cupredoxin domain-containing protein [Dehalococcoidia bacterium]